MSDEQFYLTLPSNSSFSYFPDNTVAEYVTQLPRTIALDGNWEAALAEIQYPRTWNNVGNRQMVFVVPGTGKPPQANYIPQGFYSDVSKLIENINLAIAQAGKEASDNIKFSYDNLSGRVHIEITNGAKVSFDNDIATILGFKVPFNDSIIDKTTTSPRVADVNAGLYSLYIYCDIVEAQLVGDTQVPLLRIAAVEGKHGDMVTKTFQNLQYISISKKQFNTVEIDIKTDTGEKVPFESGKSVVTLHFRRSSSSYLK